MLFYDNSPNKSFLLDDHDGDVSIYLLYTSSEETQFEFYVLSFLNK